MRRLAPLLVTAVGALLAAGCPRPQDAKTPPRASGATVRSFTESTAVTSLVASAPHVVVGTSRGLDRFDLRGEDSLHVGVAEGLPGEHVLALAVADERSVVWVATDRGLARFDSAGGHVEVIPPPSAPPLDPETVRAIAAGPGGGAFVGGPKGLFHVDRAGTWRPAGYRRPVASLLAGAGGELWIGGVNGAATRRPDGKLEELTGRPGFGLAAVRLIVEAPDGSPIFVGENEAGRTRLVALIGGAFATYRPSPEIRIVAAARRADEVLLVTPGRIFALGAAGQRRARTLERDGMHLVPDAPGAPKSPYEVLRLDRDIPPEPTAAVAVGGEVLVGTRTLGTARIPLGGARPRLRWLRRCDLVEGAVDLSVACVKPTDCFLTVGGLQGWRYDGASFTPFSPDPEGAPGAATLAVTRSPEGAVLAIFRAPEDRRLRIAKLDAGRFEPMADVVIETPGGLAALTFARFGPDGLLWLGLQTVDEGGEPRPFGVASVEPSLGAVSYHRQEHGMDSRETGVLPLPNDAADVAFISTEEVWFATASGAARLAGDKLSVFGEAEGLESEILHGIVATDGGMVYVASTRGVGVYDGARWSFPQALALVVNAIARSRDGRLWMGTDRGIAIFDGQRLRRLGPRLGFLDESIVDLTDDGLGRIWARTTLGLMILEQ